MNTTPHDNKKPEQSDADLDVVLDALQTVVRAQKAQIDALLASLEGLLVALDAPKAALSPLSPLAPVPPPSQTVPSPLAQSAGLLGNPEDPQFASLHQLMGRLKVS